MSKPPTQARPSRRKAAPTGSPADHSAVAQIASLSEGLGRVTAEIGGIKERLAESAEQRIRMEAKIDAMPDQTAKAIREALSPLVEQVGDHGHRLKQLELADAKEAGQISTWGRVWAFILAAAGIVIGWFQIHPPK